VFREVVKARPDADYVYVADDAFFPYGHHSEDAIIARVVPLIGELISAHAPDLVVIACNTASTLVMSHLREQYKVPFVGTVPAIKPACAYSKTKRVSVLGTKGTVKREYTKALIRDFAQGCEVTLVGSPDLASLAESALSGVEVSDAAGMTLRHLCRNVLTASDGHGALVLPIASEDGAAFTVKVRDALSGRTAEVAKVH